MESKNKHVAQECEDLKAKLDNGMKFKVKNVLNSEHQKDVEGWLEANKVLFLYFGFDLIADASDETIREEFDAWLAVCADYDYDIDEYKCEVEVSQRKVDKYKNTVNVLIDLVQEYRREIDKYERIVDNYERRVVNYKRIYDNYERIVDNYERIYDNYERSFDELGKALFADDEIPS